MNKMITTNNVNHKKIIALSITILLIIIWIIFSVIYIIKDKWEDYQLSQMQHGYQQGISDSIHTLVTESAECKKIPLYYGDQIIEVVDMSCLSDKKGSNTQEPVIKKPITPAAIEKPNEPATPAEQPAIIEKP